MNKAEFYDLDMNNFEFVEEININKIDDRALNLNQMEKYENLCNNENLEKNNLNKQSNTTEIFNHHQNLKETDCNLDPNKILREVLPTLSDENTQKIEEILKIKNSEFNPDKHKCEEFIIPIEVTSNSLREFGSGQTSPKNSEEEKHLNKMLEAAIPKKENLEKNLIEIISNRMKESGIHKENDETTPINLNSSTKKKKRSNKESKDELLLSSKRKRELIETEIREEESEKIRETNFEKKIEENTSRLANTKNKIDLSNSEKMSTVSSQSNTASELKNLNPITNMSFTPKEENEQKEEIPATPNILKISIVSDGAFDSKILNKIECIKCEIVDEQESEYDLLICDRLFKKFKILLAINNRLPILSSKWLEDSIMNKTKMPYDKYYTKDKEFEKKFNFNLFKTLNETPYASYMEEFCFYVSDHVANKDEIEELIESAGGRICENYKNIKKKRENLVIILDKNNDRDLIKILKAKGDYNIHSVDLIINSVITQELEIDKAKYKL